MIKNNRKNICNAIFFLFIVSVTFYLLLKDQEIPIIVDSIRRTNVMYLLLGIAAVIFFVCSESVIIHYLMIKLKSPMVFRSCIKYSFIGFFFGCITPCSTGAQPAQIYYMKKDKANLGVASLMLLEVTIAYKAVLIFLGILMLTLKKKFVMHYLGKYMGFLYFGIIINIVVVLWLSILLYHTETVRKLVNKIVSFLASLNIVKDRDVTLDKVEVAFSRYNEGAIFLKRQMKIRAVVFLITLVQRLALFLVTYFVYRAFGLSKYGVVEIVALQSVISIAVDMLPLPGGIGASENLFLIIFKKIFGTNIMPGMLLSRGISYYGLLIISAIITIVVQIRYSYREL
ncbi:lysylphosphatidylglycerol synthase transmembrane domain-containing protein [Anaerosporobacter sp.]